MLLGLVPTVATLKNTSVVGSHVETGLFQNEFDYPRGPDVDSGPEEVALLEVHEESLRGPGERVKTDVELGEGLFHQHLAVVLVEQPDPVGVLP